MKYKEKSTGEFVLQVYWIWPIPFVNAAKFQSYRIYLPTMHHDILLPN